ncbi:MAG: lysophospholipid acyltransferase family protein [Acidiferrobacterales bacterium]|jgi:1-acyl-sn-glycerol-3-phosphate acyltransferase|nr:lysophospholipid acyltransferase family protein [Acidiferrobacterales bacterium]
MMIWARSMLMALGIRRSVQGHQPGRNVMFVSNHISWIDIIVLMATSPGIFLAKSDLDGWPLIGWMCRQADTMFLQRGNARALAERMGSIRQAFGQQENVFLFPEGTTTPGEEVRAFFPGLFQAAIDSRVAVQPVALNYQEGDQRSVVVPYIDDDHFLKHFLRLLNTRSLTAQVTFLPVMNTVDQDRRQLANLTHNLISRVIANEPVFVSQTAA